MADGVSTPGNAEQHSNTNKLQLLAHTCVPIIFDCVVCPIMYQTDYIYTCM